MTARGDEHELLATLYDADGDPVDAITLSLTISHNATPVAGPFTTFERLDLGVYLYDWPVPADATPGTYLAEWSATLPGVAEVEVAYDPFEVTLPFIEGWATAEEVAVKTGVVVTEQELVTALAILEAATGVAVGSESVREGLRARDLRLIRTALAWQSVYVKATPDLFTREGNLASASTNGNSVQWGPGGSAESLVAPLALMCLRRLSWRRSRSTSMTRAKDAPRAQTLVHDGSDSEWRPLR